LTLPSFLYLPETALAAKLRERVPGTNGWIVGCLARRRAGETPGRVVRSAKSWLCHHAHGRWWRRWCGCSSRPPGCALRCGRLSPRRRTEALPLRQTCRRIIAAGNQGGCRTFPSMAEYRVYELDSSGHIAAGYSVECGSDAMAIQAAGRLLARAAGVEVWERVRCVGHLSAVAPWDRTEETCRRRSRRSPLRLRSHQAA
jgi:hypothetical protein